MKQKVLIGALLAIALSVLAGGITMAFYTAEVQTHNVITSGGVGIELIETTRETDGVEVIEGGLNYGSVMPGKTVSKIVSVENTGEGEAWIRVKVELNLLRQATAADSEIPVPPLEEAVTIHFDESGKWVKGTDGCWYYTEPVASGTSTDELFETVTLSGAMNNGYQSRTITIVINAQAVQTRNNPAVQPDTTVNVLEDVNGWPEWSTQNP